MKKMIVIFCGCLSLLFSGCTQSAPESEQLTLLSSPTTEKVNIPPEEATRALNPDKVQIAQQISFSGESDAQAHAIVGPTIYFFKASWCPTCTQLQQDLDENISRLPETTTIVTVDYDKESALKQKYGVTYQHTLVQIDTEGKEIAKWQGGGVSEIKRNLKML